MVHDFTSPDDIASFFTKKSQELHTSVNFDKVEMSGVRNDMDLTASSFTLTVIVLIVVKTLSKLLIG